MVAVMAAMTSSRCSGSGMIVATTTTDTSGSLRLGGEDGAQGGRHVGVGVYPPQPPVAEAGQLAGEVGVLLARGVKQHIQSRQPRRERPWVRPGVVHAVGQQHGPGVP